MDRVRGEEQGGEQRGLGGVVQNAALLVVRQATDQYRKHVRHEGRYDSVEKDVQHVEANRVQASRQEVVQPATGAKYSCMKVQRQRLIAIGY